MRVRCLSCKRDVKVKETEYCEDIGHTVGYCPLCEEVAFIEKTISYKNGWNMWKKASGR